MSKLLQFDWKSPVLDGLCPTALDWARLAAYLDGEGSILINPRSAKRKEYSDLASMFYLRITVANTDVRLPAWIKQNFGGSFIDANTEKYYEGKNYKRCWHWSTASTRAAWILFNCAPYLILKAEQAEIGIRLQETMRPLSEAGHRKKLPLEVINERRELKQRLLKLKARGKVMEPAQLERINEVNPLVQ